MAVLQKCFRLYFEPDLQRKKKKMNETKDEKKKDQQSAEKEA